MSSKYRFISGAAVVLLVAATSVSVQAGSNAGAFIGGIFATKIMGNMQARTQAEQQQAYYAQRPVQQAAPAASSTQTTEQKLDELNKRAAGGYITPAEYKQKKQAIINTL